MKAVIFFLLFSFQVNLISAQVFPILTDQLILPSKRQPRKSFVAYEIGGIQLFNGTDKESKFFYILDENTGKRLFEFDERQLKARRFTPRFFAAPESEDLIILVMSLDGDFSWGVHIFIIDHGKVSHPGFLSYGVDNFNFASLGLHSQFEQHGDAFVMFFQEGARLINYETDELVLGKDIEFKIERTKITRLH
jgi:hypothetical protein